MSVLVVTGGSQGIGAAICRLAAARGWQVCFSYSRDAAPADALVEEITEAGGVAKAVRADAADGAAVENLFAAADMLGPVTGLVANAGITGPVALLDAVTPAIIDQVMAVNVRGVFLAIKAATPRMTAHGGGAIVNISSRASGIGGGGEWVHYAASKGAVDTITLGAAKELAPKGIRVNAVVPGLIDTEIHAKAGDAGRISRMGGSVPLGRAGTATEVAYAALWLLSEEAAYVTGALLPVSGGR